MTQELLDTGWTLVLVVAAVGSAFLIGFIGVTALLLLLAAMNVKLRRKL